MEEAASKKADDYGSSRPDKPGKKGKEKAKKKSNLEIFKDELKAIQVSWVQLLFCEVLISKISIFMECPLICIIGLGMF